MGICGYNAKMGDGIRLLFEGMYEAISDKSKAEGISVVDVLRRELIEIPRINVALRSGDQTALTMFYGLNVMALAHFSTVLEKSERDKKRCFAAEVEEFIRCLEEVEDFTLTLPRAEPQSDEAIGERASQIAEWISRRYCLEKV
jgi:hypothetical protein